jgi:diguanylate cyclase (GGDEF)-like protein
MLGFADGWIALVYILCILSTALCVVYGIANWNRGAEQEAKQVEEQLRFVSFHDSLTGLYNRAYFEQEIIRIYTEKVSPLGMVSCDVDGLKLINDTLGHHAGDTLLKTVAGILTDCFDSSQPFARTGGDEFAALLPGCSEESTRAAYKRILQRMEEHNRDNPNIPVSLSVGWSWKASSTEAAVDALVREADRRMYRNKQESRIRYTALFRQCFEQFGHGLFQKGV